VPVDREGHGSANEESAERDLQALSLDVPRHVSAAAAAPFRLDYDQLAAQGFFVPTEKPRRLPLELRAIKRRLLRRLKFQKRRAGTGDLERRQPNIVLMTSTRPAEGKTFTAINLALSLAIEDRIGTVLVDADVPRPKVRHHLGLERHCGLTDLIARHGDIRLKECLRREETIPFALLSEGTSDEPSAELFAREEARLVLEDLSARFPDRLIIVDAPPVLATTEALLLAPLVDEILFVVEAHGTPEPAVATALDELLDLNERISLVLNRCLVSDGATHYGSYNEYYYRYGRKRG
jgi:Mrp family chromosome partitioning ATPase